MRSSQKFGSVLFSGFTARRSRDSFVTKLSGRKSSLPVSARRRLIIDEPEQLTRVIEIDAQQSSNKSTANSQIATTRQNRFLRTSSEPVLFPTLWRSDEKFTMPLTDKVYNYSIRIVVPEVTESGDAPTQGRLTTSQPVDR